MNATRQMEKSIVMYTDEKKKKKKETEEKKMMKNCKATEREFN